VLLAAVAAALWTFGTPKAKHYLDPALEKTFHPMTPSPAPVSAGTPTAAAAAAAWNSWVSQPDQPVYREWLPQAGGWILADSQCTPIRGSFIADPAPRALPAAPRAELVSMPVRRATLV
jgi:hypothetical protein